MKISEAIAVLERIKRDHGDHEVWLLGKAGWEEVRRIAEVIEPEQGDGKYTACMIGLEGAPEDAVLEVERGYQPPIHGNSPAIPLKRMVIDAAATGWRGQLCEALKAGRFVDVIHIDAIPNETELPIIVRQFGAHLELDKALKTGMIRFPR
jgi:hypothetical protein